MKSRLLQPVAAKNRATPMLDHFAALNKRTQAKRKVATEPEVGIFFVYNGKPFIDGTPVSEAEGYGAFKTHGRGHDAFWRELQRNGIVPPGVEYDEVPRGRVGYDTKEGKFYVFADPCILKNERLLDKIESDMSLPSAKTAPPKGDPHYKCPGCRKSKKQLRQEEEDWDI